MFEDWKERRRLKQEIAELEREKVNLEKDFIPEYQGDTAKSPALSRIRFKIYNRKNQITAIETDKLTRKAMKFGIEIPKDKPNWVWDDFDDNDGENWRVYLTDIGKAGMSKLIKEEKRKSIEFWVKIIGGVITLLTGLVGSIIGVIAILKK